MNDSKVLDLAILIASQFYAKRAEFLIGFGWREVIDVGVFVLGMVVMFICLCRMSRMSNKHRWGPRLSYVSLFTASFTLSFAPWLFGAEFVRLGAALFSLAVIGHLVVIGLDWCRGEPPKSFETAPAPLEGELR
ncbi:MAG TPA: hypothetical protein PLS11_16520 [Ottowia sp.]|nr:hypothetical protein [Ottowia sp.]